MVTKLTKESISKEIDSIDSDLRDIATKIHENPELGYEEYKASKWLSDYLEENDFNVTRGVAGLETAFIATLEGSESGPTIGLLAEYDALPGLGHACGHNLIGTASVGAAVGIKKNIKDFKGTLKVIGTPAEEGLGGKVIMAEDKVFDDLDVAMMCHPKNRTMILRGGLARVSVTLKFYGKESHASSAPELGVSALDAMLNSFNSINSLRQFFTDDVRIHGVITHGGEAANIVPGYCEAKFLIRSVTLERLKGVKEKVFNAVKNASNAVGAECEIVEHLQYAERNENKTMAKLFGDNLESMGIEISPPPKVGGLGSSDIGNVSQIIPTIHPYIKIGESINHTKGFTEDSISEKGMKALNSAAKALAMTAYDISANSNFLKKIQDEFNNK